MATAEAINIFPQIKPEFTPYLRLVPDVAEVVEVSGLPYEGLAERRANQFKGQVILEHLQAEYDVTTQFAELVDGNMRTEFELTFDGEDLYGPDGRSLTEAGINALEQARHEAKKNPNLWFEVGRRSTELDEILALVDMAKGNGANTMIVRSDFPEVLRDAKEDVGGYNTTRQQAMGRIVTIDPEGKITLYSQTLDGSNRQALEAVDADLGFETEPGETLSQRRAVKLSPKEQKTIIDRMVGIYDHEMSNQYGGELYAGRRPADYRNTYDFVCQQRDLVEECVRLKLSGNLTASMMYDMAATMQARFEKNQSAQEAASQTSEYATIITSPASITQAFYKQDMLYREIRMAGKEARSEGKRFSACGLTLTAEGTDESTEGQLENAGFGNKANIEKSWHGGKKFKNDKCVSCNKVKSETGACHICEDCVKNPKQHKLGTVQGRTKDPKQAKVNKESAQVFSLDGARKAKEKNKGKTS